MIIPLLEAAGVECFTRSEWGSYRQGTGDYDRRRGTHPMPSGPARYHFLHITVTSDTDTVLEGKAGARQVEGYGLSTPPMVSYQDLVTNEGKYFEGQSYGVKGTHTVNDKDVPGFPNDLNLFGYAAAIMQNVGDEVTDVQVQVLAMVYAAREIKGLVRRGAPVYPHRMFAWKECPGDKAVYRLDEIVRLKNKYVREGLPNVEEFTMQKDEFKAWVSEAVRDEFSEVKSDFDEVKQAILEEGKKTRERNVKGTLRLLKQGRRDRGLTSKQLEELITLLGVDDAQLEEA